MFRVDWNLVVIPRYPSLTSQWIWPTSSEIGWPQGCWCWKDFGNDLQLASRYRFQKGLFLDQQRKTNQLVQVFFAPISEWFPLVWNLWDFFVDFFFFSRDSLKATFWNSKLWPVRKGFTAAAALYLFLCWYKARGNEAPTLIRCNFGMGSGCHGLTESFTESVMIFKLWLNRGWE